MSLKVTIVELSTKIELMLMCLTYCTECKIEQKNDIGKVVLNQVEDIEINPVHSLNCH